MATIAICCLLMGGTSATVFWCYRMYKARAGGGEGLEQVYTYAPETKPFDQGFTDYPREKEEVQETFRCHREDGFVACKFLQRIIHLSVPLRPRREAILYNVDLRRYAGVINYVAGPRTYFVHFPESVAAEVRERVGSGASIEHGRGGEGEKGMLEEHDVELHLEHEPHEIDEDLIIDDPASRSSRFSRSSDDLRIRGEDGEDGEDGEAEEKLPLVLCLHGTDETAFDTVLLQQEDGSRSWLDLSDREGFVVAFAQARGQWADEVQAYTSWRPLGDLVRTLWVNSALDENKIDVEYLRKIVADVKILCPRLDLSRVYVVGFSNGGFMACDVALESRKLALQFCSERQRARAGGSSATVLPQAPAAPAWWADEVKGEKYNLGSFHLAGVCMYMGGITKQQQVKLAGIRDKDLPNPEAVEGCRRSTPGDVVVTDLPKMLIITGEQDPQIFNSLQAWLCFYKLGFYVKKELMEEAEHQYLPNNTEQIWTYFNEEVDS